MKKFLLAAVPIMLILLSFSPSFSAKKALLIGIADYQALPSSSRGGISDLRGSINDVKAIREGLITYYGFPKRDIRVLTDEKATLQNIKAAFDEWLVNGTRAGDTAVLYFSGHGSTVPDQNADEDDGVDEVLCPYDMIPRGGYNIILDDELALWLKRLSGRRVVVIIDSCHSGGQTRSIGRMPVSILEDVPSKAARFIPITNYQPSPIATARARGSDVPESVIFMAASRENEIALEVSLPDGFRGGFSFGLCEAIKALPNAPYQSLFDHAKDVVKDRLKLAQEPQLVGNKDVRKELAFKDVQIQKRNKKQEEKPEVRPLLGDNRPHMRPQQTSSQPVTTAEEVSVEPVTPPEQTGTQPVTPPEQEITEQTGTEPVRPSPEKNRPPVKAPKPNTKPAAPPEIIGETVLVTIENLGGCDNNEMETMRQGLSSLGIVDVVENDAFFDRLVRGEKRNGMHHIRLINGIGDVEKVEPARTMDELVRNLKKQLEYAFMVKQLGRIHHPNQPFKVKAWVTDENRRDFWFGENIVFGVRSERDCHIILINLDGKGNFHIIYPNQYHQDNFIPANTDVFIPDEAMSRSQFQLQFGAPAGEETVKVIATTQPLNLRGLGLGDFRGSFQNIPGGTRTIFVKAVIDNLSSEGIEWSEGTVVIRSHERQRP